MAWLYYFWRYDHVMYVINREALDVGSGAFNEKKRYFIKI